MVCPQSLQKMTLILHWNFDDGKQIVRLKNIFCQKVKTRAFRTFDHDFGTIASAMFPHTNSLLFI